MNRIFITGDTHGLYDFDSLKEFATKEKLDRSDYIIIAGDCSVVWSKEYLPQYIPPFEELGATILYIDGNHENFDMLETYPVTMLLGGEVNQISTNIYHLRRGEVFEIYGKKIFVMGGGESGGISNLKEHIDWWMQESITAEDMSNAIKNLASYDNTVDIVVSHVPPTSVLELVGKELAVDGEELPWYIKLKLEPKVSNNYLQKISDTVSFDKWYFGHIHLDMDLGDYIGIFNNIIEIK